MHDKLVKKRFGWWVEDKREALGLSRTELGERCGMTADQISKVEYGVHLPYGERMLKMLIALGADDEKGMLREIVERMGEK